MRCLAKLLSVLCLVCAGCAGDMGLTSETGRAEEGIVYHLPRSILEITVREYRSSDGARVWYSLGGPDNLADTKPQFADVPRVNKIKSSPVPDLHHRYVIKYHPSKLSDDRLCVSRKPNGLLHDVQFAADDRTPQIVFNIAQFVGGFAGSNAYFHQSIDAEKVTVRSYTAKVDPFDPEEMDVGAYDRALKHIFNADLRLNFKRLVDTVRRTANVPTGCSQKDGCPAVAWGTSCDNQHICYRNKLTLPVGLDLDGKTIDTKYADVINPWDIGSISVTRAFLVKKVTKLRFQDGTLLAAIIRKPSEVEEATLLPLNVMNAILSVPSGLWKSAFADDDTKNRAIAALSSQNEQISQFKKHDALLLEGSGATKDENYDLNCQVTGTAGTLLNWVGDTEAVQ